MYYKGSTMNRSVLKAALAGLILSVSSFANAGIITFTDRVDYEAYINGAITDDFLDVTDGSGSTGVRSGYNWDMSDFGCASGPGQCGDNSSQNFSYDDNYIWTYNNGSFTFDSNIFAFGFDFGSANGNTSVTLNGLQSQQTSTGGFFGIASTDSQGFNVVNYTKPTNYGLFDKLTYATQAVNATQVPEPSTLAIFALGIMGLASRRFKK
jgi:hypothetical protein